MYMRSRTIANSVEKAIPPGVLIKIRTRRNFDPGNDESTPCYTGPFPGSYS